MILSNCKPISCRWCLKMVSLLFLLISLFLISTVSFFLNRSGLRQCVLAEWGAEKWCQFTWSNETVYLVMGMEWAENQEVRSVYRGGDGFFYWVSSSFIVLVMIWLSVEYKHRLFRKFVSYFAGWKCGLLYIFI